MSATATAANPLLSATMVLPVQGHTPLLSSLQNASNWRISTVSSFAELQQQEAADIVLIATDDIYQCNQSMHYLSANHPQTVRVLIYPPEQQTNEFSHCFELSHYCLSKNESTRTFINNATQLIKLNRLVHKTRTQDYVNSLGKLPSPPEIYQELSQALGSEQSNARQLSKIISKDPALATKVLKEVNSAYFGFPRNISNIQEAVTLLGVRLLRALSISGQLLNQYPQHRNWSYFSFEKLNQRAVLVARLAQEICKDLRLNTQLTDQAFIGGLLHDLGLLIFASQDSQSYRKIMIMSAQKQTHICIIEKQLLGLFHGEVAAYLLSQWKLPPAITEAVLLHHTPQLSVNKDISPLTAVHIADALLPEAETEIGALVGNQLHHGYINQLGLEDRITGWQKKAAHLQQLSVAH